MFCRHHVEHLQYRTNHQNHDISTFVTPHSAKICAKVHAKAAKWKGMNMVTRCDCFRVILLISRTLDSLSSMFELLTRA
jgi:hypothetical protein